MVEASICLKNWLSESHQPIIIQDFMDEVEALETSEYLEAGNFLNFYLVFQVLNISNYYVNVI